MKALDEIDRKVLFELDRNARVPVSKIAKKLRQSRERIDYRIKNLVKRGIIRKFVTMINPAKLGYSIYKMYFKFQNLAQEKEQQMLDWLTKNTFVYWIASAKGKWDLNITIFARNITHLEEVMTEFYSKYGDYVLEQEFNTTLVVGIKSKDWVLSAPKLPGSVAYVGGENVDRQPDTIDIELLKVLANNARMNALELAKRLVITQKMVLYRIKRLEEKEIILGYTTSLNLELLGMQFFKATISFNVMTHATKMKIIEYCRNSPHVGFFIFCIGSWPLEIEMIVKDNTEFYKAIDDFRRVFPEMKGYETVLFPKEYKFDWMPLCYTREH